MNQFSRESAESAGEESSVLPTGRGNVIQKTGIPPSSRPTQSKNGAGHHETVETQWSLWSWCIILLTTISTSKSSVGYRSCFSGHFHKIFVVFMADICTTYCKWRAQPPREVQRPKLVPTFFTKYLNLTWLEVSYESLFSVISFSSVRKIRWIKLDTSGKIIQFFRNLD